MATKQNKRTSGAPAPHVHTKHLRYSWKAGLMLLALLTLFLVIAVYLYNYDSDNAVIIPHPPLKSSQQ